MLCFTSILIRQSKQPPGATWKTTAMNDNRTQKSKYTSNQFNLRSAHLTDFHIHEHIQNITTQILSFIQAAHTNTSPSIQCQCFNYVNDQAVSYCTAQGIKKSSAWPIWLECTDTHSSSSLLSERTVYRVDWWIIHHLTPWEMAPTGHCLPITLSVGNEALICEDAGC